ncbi:hypothetical protein B0H16DRAFT_1464299 [Mycena metata]|uniref:Uncharacterized protein n=1 Tax=Mycena metata TaxID=1033252 RepID=A0AAD7N2S2_9AGAR|nr:hypothetical protein B0H16DRAFT_1464299 [Mycena metata]
MSSSSCFGLTRWRTGATVSWIDEGWFQDHTGSFKFDRGSHMQHPDTKITIAGLFNTSRWKGTLRIGKWCSPPFRWTRIVYNWYSIIMLPRFDVRPQAGRWSIASQLYAFTSLQIKHRANAEWVDSEVPLTYANSVKNKEKPYAKFQRGKKVEMVLIDKVNSSKEPEIRETGAEFESVVLWLGLRQWSIAKKSAQRELSNGRAHPQSRKTSGDVAGSPFESGAGAFARQAGLQWPQLHRQARVGRGWVERCISSKILKDAITFIELRFVFVKQYIIEIFRNLAQILTKKTRPSNVKHMLLARSRKISQDLARSWKVVEFF